MWIDDDFLQIYKVMKVQGWDRGRVWGHSLVGLGQNDGYLDN